MAALATTRRERLYYTRYMQSFVAQLAALIFDQVLVNSADLSAAVNASSLSANATTLKARFEDAFWDEVLGMYVSVFVPASVRSSLKMAPLCWHVRRSPWASVRSMCRMQLSTV